MPPTILLSPTDNTTPFGVGLDTARYGHHVTFLQHDLQLACTPFSFPESRSGYQRLHQQFQRLSQRHPQAHFYVRLDVAGQYAANLETFLRSLEWPLTLSVGEPARNHSYRQTFFPKCKADPTDSYCAARFALRERPPATPGVPPTLLALRELVGRLEGQTRQSTRLANQLHNLLARVFPELASLASDLQANWVRQLLGRYPTPSRVARARLASLTAIGHLSAEKASQLQQLATTSIASFTGAMAESLVGQFVGQLNDSLAQEEQLRSWMIAAYQQLPSPNHLDSIPGIGLATAAVLTAKVIDIGRFKGPAQLVSYFGVFPQEESSGVDKGGQTRTSRQRHMSRKGNDLARKYLWNAALTARTHNPAVRALFERLRGRGSRGDVALGHGMRKLLHLVFAVWKTGKPFDPCHYDWQGGSQVEGGPKAAAGHKRDEIPEGSVVTAADCSLAGMELANQTEPNLGGLQPGEGAPSEAGGIDYAALRARVSLEEVLRRLDWLDRLGGSGQQRRGPCPLHAPEERSGRSFSVHLGKKVFRCFHPPCGQQGNVLDLWAAYHGLPLYQAARHLAGTLGLEL